ncbi:MAG: tRNA (guanosine(46)-N7)-methyltransferase TrmB [Verrucomicrobia bacterium GWF2_51_19]|nr:MAG: tRNA (guanosine(46)-N7)-methyltransferase TrmB [Verrucomicrobia bacterium GWF2_51_19]
MGYIPPEWLNKQAEQLPRSAEPMPVGLERLLSARRARVQDLRQWCAEHLDGVAVGILEIGCGHGRFLVEAAMRFPEKVCVGLDVLSRRLRSGEEKRERRGLQNVFFVKAEAAEFVEAMPAKTFGAVYILFPDPWPKRKHAARRLIQNDFLTALAAKLVPGSKVFFRTDDKVYYKEACKRFSEHSHWSLDTHQPWPCDSTTYFEEVTGGYRSLVAVRNLLISAKTPCHWG